MHSIQEQLLKLVGTKNLGSLTLREIGELIGEKFPQKIKHHLTQLERKGLIKINKAASSIERSTQGLIKNSKLVSIPILGTANCGPTTLFADQNIEGYLKMSSKLLGKKKGVFAIKASGLSMNKAAVNSKTIEEGDYLIIDKDEITPRNHDIVLAIIDDTAVVKRYIWDAENEQVILVSDSTKDLPPIYIHPDDKFTINGKVVQVIKKPKL
jgi:repressor LexA